MDSSSEDRTWDRTRVSSSDRTRYSKEIGGFTLIELVMVLILVAIIAATAVLNWPGGGLNLAAQADQIKGDIRYTQSLAMNRGQYTRINLAADRYWLSNFDNSVRLSHPVVDLADVMLDSGITLATTNAFVVFDNDGAPCSDALIPCTALAADAVITLSIPGQNRTVRISPETGRVLVP